MALHDIDQDLSKCLQKKNEDIFERPDDNDKELIKCVQKGDENAFNRLMNKYEDSIYNVVYNELPYDQRTVEDAEEITNDIKEKVYQKLYQLNDLASFPGWLYRITKNTYKNWCRKNQRRLKQSVSLDCIVEKTSVWSEQEYDDQCLRQKVNDTLEELDENDRLVLTLHYIAGRSCKEIGRLIGRSVSVIENWLSRARKHFKEKWDKDTLRGFLLLPFWLWDIMRPIANGLRNSALISKPLTLWIGPQSIAVLTSLIIWWWGIGQNATLQPPDSLDAFEWAGGVEHVDKPVFEKPLLKLSQVNQARGSSGGKSENGNQENDSVQKTAADSQNNTTSDNIDWTPVGGPDGGMVNALHATPEGTLFAGTLTGGIFRSTDGGETWVSASKGLRVYENNGLPSISTLTQKGNNLYASTGDGLFYSTNGGDSWQQLTHFQRDRRISGIAIIDDTVYIGYKQSVFFSNDNGESWTLIDKGLTGQGEPRLSVSGMTLFAQMERHVFHLKAGEKSWTKLAIEDPSQKKVVDSDITKFAISGETIYAATADGDLFRSTNMGSSWKSIKPKGMQGFDGKLAALGNMVFYIGSNSANGRVFRSTNSGNSWTMLNTNLTDQAILSTEVLSEKTLYVGTFKGVFRSTDGGESWIKTSTGIINTWIRKLVFVKNVLYALTFDSIVKSADGGNSWVPVNEELIASDVATLAVSGEELYVVTDSRIYRLAEDGNSWLPIQTNMQSSNGRISSVSQLVFNEDTFYIVAGRERLYRWRMGEDLWTDLGLEVSYLTDLAVSDRTVYVGSDDGKLFCSFDEGETWTDVSQNLPNPTQETGLSDLVFVGETIYAKSRDRVFRSRDSGETWTSINTGLPDGYIDMQLVDGTTLYGTNSHGIFRLTHESDSWERIAPTHHQVMALAFDGTTFYAGTLRQGVYRLSLEE